MDALLRSCSIVISTFAKHTRRPKRAEFLSELERVLAGLLAPYEAGSQTDKNLIEACITAVVADIIDMGTTNMQAA
jgi:hypothetical protein